VQRWARQSGFTYIAVLVLVALAGVALAGAGQLWSTASKRDKEAPLLFVGDEFRRAIGSYYEASPGAKQFPQKLEDLLEDRRVPIVRRHLRQIYVDPMTGKPEWGLVKYGDRIIGVHTLSEEKPLKTGNFKADNEEFKGSAAYADWRFVYKPSARVPIPGAPALPPGAGGSAQSSRPSPLPSPKAP